MRTLSAAALAALNLNSPKFFLLAEINFSSTLRITSTSFDLTLMVKYFHLLTQLLVLVHLEFPLQLTEKFMN